jgi:hypothetical protein
MLFRKNVTEKSFMNFRVLSPVKINTRISDIYFKYYWILLCFAEFCQTYSFICIFEQFSLIKEMFMNLVSFRCIFEFICVLLLQANLDQLARSL